MSEHNSEVQTARVLGRATVIAAAISAVAIVLVAVLGAVNDWFGLVGRKSESTGPSDLRTAVPDLLKTDALGFVEIDAIPQPVNRKAIPHDGSDTPPPMPMNPAEEISTFRCVVENKTKTSIVVDHADLLIDEVSESHGAWSQLACMTLIDHHDHIQAWVMRPKIGDMINVYLRTEIAPDAKSEFTLWIRSADRDPPSILSMVVRLRLYDGGGEMATSRPFNLEIHKDSREFPTYAELMDQFKASVPTPAPLSD